MISKQGLVVETSACELMLCESEEIDWDTRLGLLANSSAC